MELELLKAKIKESYYRHKHSYSKEKLSLIEQYIKEKEINQKE